jgi:hypothetical protein
VSVQAGNNVFMQGVTVDLSLVWRNPRWYKEFEDKLVKRFGQRLGDSASHQASQLSKVLFGRRKRHKQKGVR